MKMILINLYKTRFLLVLLMAGSLPVLAQVDTAFKQEKISYATYLKMVGKNNLGYVAERFNVSIARAEAVGARVFPDPELSFGTADNGQKRMKMGYAYNVGLAYTLELGGKRKARIDLANRQAELAQLLLEDYFRNLQADATTAFLLAMKQKAMIKVKLNSYEMMSKLSQSDSIRLKLGAITEIDARQSKLEAESQLNDLFQQEADWKTSMAGLNLLLGRKQDVLLDPSGDFAKFNREFDLQKLIENAQTMRSDLLAALKNKEISKTTLQLTRANRVIDLGLSLGVTANAVVSNVVAPTPSSSVVALGISLPLKFSNNNKGALKSAHYGVQQTEVLYQQTALQIQTEVIQAYYNYLASQKQVKQFAGDMLMNAQKVLDGKVYSYKRGETSLLEVLTAQRTFNEVQQSYLETLNANAVALIELEKASGIWDLDF